MSYSDAPTDKQLAFIERLAKATGEKVTSYPRDRRSASKEIERLLMLEDEHQLETATA
ncbi:MAG: hypothetical protein ACRDK2_03480 [Solirubrobacteraceae bacterium]